MIKELFNNYIIDFISNKRAENFREKNRLVLASCYLFIFPFFFILITKLNKRIILLTLSGIQVLLSVAGDYYFVEDKEFGRKVTMVDRIFALMYAIYLIYYVIPDNPFLAIIGTVTTIFFIEYARKSPTFDIWVSRHILWHFVCNIIVLLFLNIIRKKDEKYIRK